MKVRRASGGRRPHLTVSREASVAHEEINSENQLMHWDRKSLHIVLIHGTALVFTLDRLIHGVADCSFRVDGGGHGRVDGGGGDIARDGAQHHH
jgi:hypothetical protein